MDQKVILLVADNPDREGANNYVRKPRQFRRFRGRYKTARHVLAGPEPGSPGQSI